MEDTLNRHGSITLKNSAAVHNRQRVSHLSFAVATEPALIAAHLMLRPRGAQNKEILPLPLRYCIGLKMVRRADSEIKNEEGLGGVPDILTFVGEPEAAQTSLEPDEISELIRAYRCRR